MSMWRTLIFSPQIFLLKFSMYKKSTTRQQLNRTSKDVLSTQGSGYGKHNVMLMREAEGKQRFDSVTFATRW